MKPLAITLGDPAGIGYEVVLKALDGFVTPVILYGSRRLAKAAETIPTGIRIVDVGPAPGVQLGQISAEAGRVALDSIDAALAAIESGECSALVTAPLHKRAIELAGSLYPGHTEMLAARAGLKRYAHDHAMFFDSPELCVALLTVHVPLREAIRSIDADSIAALARLTSREYARLYGELPRVAVAALNPHAGEGGKFGDEEETIARGVELARADGISISGPHPADTIFLAARRGRYDVVLAMYHDQALIPIKTVDFERSVNVTIGLPYLRCSVDHGTAFEIAGKGVADPAPMRYAIEWAARHAEGYRQ